MVGKIYFKLYETVVCVAHLHFPPLLQMQTAFMTSFFLFRETWFFIETMWLREICPQSKLPINVKRGSMALQCNTYFPKTLSIQSIRAQIKFNLPSLMKPLTDFLLITEISTAFYFSIFRLQTRPTIAAKMYD